MYDPGMPDLVVATTLENGAVLRLLLNAPRGNILDIAMIQALDRVLERDGRAASLKAILFEGAGDHFSYGASVEEHRPGKVAGMLSAFHGMFRRLASLDRTLIAVVRGQCLGGGMELACFCHRVFASPGARFGQPEIALGVFAPVASLILARRSGQGVADDVCLTGRVLSAQEALVTRLIDEVADDPRAAADAWIAQHLAPKSAASLARAVKAVRLQWNAAFLRDLSNAETIYLDDLMRTEDAKEGIEAFLARRPPAWKNR